MQEKGGGRCRRGEGGIVKITGVFCEWHKDYGFLGVLGGGFSRGGVVFGGNLKTKNGELS